MTCETDKRWTLHHGDCLAWLRTLPSESVDSVVTDPPAGISFMGKAWDHHKGGRIEWVAWLASVMAECLRVLKPGGHALVWSLPRTEHWTACAVEDAGFEIRDGVYHLCAQGWPKSLDVSKALDAMAGSGTTGVAAILEGCRFIAAEADADSVETARARLALAERGEIAPPKEPKPKRPCKAAEPQPALFIATEDDPCAA